MINLNKVLDTLTEKPIYYGLIAMLLTIYGPRLHPKLPDGIRDLFNNDYFRFSIIAIIIYLSNRDLQLALLISIMFVIIMSLSNSCHCHDVLQEKFGLKESFSDFDTISEFYEEFNNGSGNEDDGGNEEEEEDLPENQVQNSTDDNADDNAVPSVPNADADTDPDADAIADAVAEADAAVAPTSSSPDSNNDVEKTNEEKDKPVKTSVETYMSQGAEVMGGLMNKVKGILTNDSENVQEKYTNRPSLYESYQNVNVDFEDGSSAEDQDKIEKFINNNTTNGQLHQYENFLKKTVNQYKFL